MSEIEKQLEFDVKYYKTLEDIYRRKRQSKEEQLRKLLTDKVLRENI